MQTDEAAELLSTLPQDDLSVRCVSLLAEHVGTSESVLDDVRELLAELADAEGAGSVRPVAATILELEGETSEALRVLAEGVKEQDQEWWGPPFLFPSILTALFILIAAWLCRYKSCSP